MRTRRRTSPAFGYGFHPASEKVPAEAAGVEPARKTPPAGAAVHGLMPILVDDDGAAALLGVSRRTFTDLIDAPWMCRAIQLGVRLRRWSIDELRAAVARMPRETARAPQPTALRTRIDAMKGGGDAC